MKIISRDGVIPESNLLLCNFHSRAQSASTLAVLVTTRQCVGTMGTAPLQVCVATSLYRGVFASMNTLHIHRYLAPELQFLTNDKYENGPKQANPENVAR